MPPRMTTQSAGRETAAPRGGRTGGRTGRGGGRTRGQSGDKGNGGIDGQGGQVGGQGTEVNVGVDKVPDFSTIIAQQLQNLLSSSRQPRNVIDNNNRRGCTYKEFLACNLKEYDGKGGAIVYTRWIEKMESVQDMSGCEDNQKVKYTAGSFFGKALSWWNSQIHTRSQEAAFVRAGHVAYTDKFHELARHAHTFMDHDSTYQSCGSWVVAATVYRREFLQVYVEFRRISLTGFRSCASRSQTRASQSRQSTE
ncbi:hypothetical protein Tco_1456517 [Tanacetum coccineum]